MAFLGGHDGADFFVGTLEALRGQLVEEHSRKLTPLKVEIEKL